MTRRGENVVSGKWEEGGELIKEGIELRQRKREKKCKCK